MRIFPYGMVSTTNIFVAGLGWLLIGYYVAENFQAVSKISKKVLIASALAGYISYIFFSFAFNVYFAPILVAIVELLSPLAIVPVFMFAVRNGAQSVKYPSFIMKIGVEYSLYIYIPHAYGLYAVITSAPYWDTFRHRHNTMDETGYSAVDVYCAVSPDH